MLMVVVLGDDVMCDVDGVCERCGGCCGVVVWGGGLLVMM